MSHQNYHVTLLQDLDAGKNCCYEAAAAIRDLVQQLAAAKSESDSWVRDCVRTPMRIAMARQELSEDGKSFTLRRPTSFSASLATPRVNPELDELRQELEKQAADNALVYASFRTAEYMGLKGDEKFVLLAASAMRNLDATAKVLHDIIARTPPAPFIPTS